MKKYLALPDSKNVKAEIIVHNSLLHTANMEIALLFTQDHDNELPKT